MARNITHSHIQLSILFLMAAFGIMGGGLMAPALPSLVGPFNIDAGSVGLVLGVYTLSAALTLPLTGLMLDVFGRRKVALACLVIDGVFGVLCTIAPNFTVLLVFRFFQGIGIAALIPVAVTVISDWYHGQVRLKIMGYMSATISMSAVFIPVIGGYLATINWQYPFMVYGLSLVLAVFYFFNIPESGIIKESSGSKDMILNYLLSLRGALKLPAVRKVFMHALILYFLLYAMVVYFPLLLSVEYGLTLTMAGVALAFQAFISSIVASQAFRIDRKMSRNSRLVAGYFLLFSGFILIPFWENYYQLHISLFLLGIGMGTLMPTIFHWTTTAGPNNLTGTIISLFTTVKFIGMTLAPVLLRFPHFLYGINGVFVVSALLAFIWSAKSMLNPFQEQTES